MVCCISTYLYAFVILDSVWGSIEAPAFSFSSVQYSPNSPGSTAAVTVSFASSVSIPAGTLEVYTVSILFPVGFVPEGTVPSLSNCTAMFLGAGATFLDDCTQLSTTWDVLLPLAHTTLTGSVDEVTGVLSPVVYFDTNPASSTFNSVLVRVLSLSAQESLSIEFCCLQITSSLNSIVMSLIQHSSGGGASTVIIPPNAVQWSPRILIASAWTQLRLQFPSSSQLTVTFEVGDTLPQGTRIIADLPGFSSEFTNIFFTQLISDAVFLLNYTATWNSSALQFELNSELPANVLVSLTTEPGQFALPTALALNSPNVTLGAFSSNFHISWIPETIFFQTDEILPPILFLYSEIYIPDLDLWESNLPMSVMFRFVTNRSLFPGTTLYLRLPGYQTVEHDLEFVPNDLSALFANAVFDPSTSTISVNVIGAVYFDENSSIGNLTFQNLLLPLGQYANDESLLVSVGTMFAPIQNSQQFGVDKFFVQSSLVWLNPVPNGESGISVAFESSVDLFGGTQVRIQLRGNFERMMVSYDIPLTGACAAQYLENELAQYDPLYNVITVQVANETIMRGVCEFSIPQTSLIRLPSQLSVNDGSLLIEASNQVVIRPRQVAESGPQVGVLKSMENSTITFSPLIPENTADINLQMSFNTDLLTGSALVVHLGGFMRIGGDNEAMSLTGADTALFASVSWNDTLQDLTLIVGAQPVSSGSNILVSVPYTWNLVLPLTLSFGDLSLWVTVVDSGIWMPQYFDTSDPVNSELAKEMQTSQVAFSTDDPSGVLSGHVGSIFFYLTPTFRIRYGAILVLGFPGGFATSNTTVVLADRENLQALTGTWGNNSLSIAFTGDVPSLTNIAFSVGNFTFPESTLVNDPGFTVAISGAQILPKRQMARSPAIVPQNFEMSVIDFLPKIPKTTTSVFFNLSATITLNVTDAIVITLTGFTLENPSATIPIACSVNGTQIASVEAFWTDPKLSVQLGVAVDAYVAISCSVSEQVGFILPQWLALNDPGISAAVQGKIADTPFLSSPLIGDGPYLNQQFCAFMGQVGVQVALTNGECDCAIADPCVPAQLAACKCPSSNSNDFNIRGFNLLQSDSVFFASPGDTDCSGTSAWQIQRLWNSTTTLLPNNGISFSGIRPIRAGTFPVCVRHLGLLLPAGTLFVRPGCPGSQVLMESTCLSHCPFGYLPISGACVLAPPSASLAATTTLWLTYPNADGLKISTAVASDSTYVFFSFVFTQNLNDLLYETDPARFVITSIASDATANITDLLVVTVVITPPTEFSTGRKSGEILAVLNAMISDGNSAIFSNFIFATLIAPFSQSLVSASQLAGQPSAAFYCPQTGTYNTVCPLAIDPLPTSPLGVPSWYNISVLLGGLVGGALCGLILLGLFRADASANAFLRKRRNENMNRSNLADQDNNFSIIKIVNTNGKKVGGRKFSLLDASAKAEFARSWLDGQLVDETLFTRSRIDRPTEDQAPVVAEEPPVVTKRKRIKSAATSSTL